MNLSNVGNVTTGSKQNGFNEVRTSTTLVNLEVRANAEELFDRWGIVAVADESHCDDLSLPSSYLLRWRQVL